MASFPLSYRLKRILAHYRAGGFARILKHLLDYGCVHHWVLWLADVKILGRVGTAETKTLQPISGYTFRSATENDLDAILLCIPVIDRSQLDSLFRKFFHDGYRCVFVLFDKQVVGYLWAFTGEYVITLDDYRRRNLRVSFPPDAIFIGNAYVTPAHRGHGLYQRMSLYLMERCPSSACFYVSISDLNAPSIAVNHKLGFTELATLRFIGVFRRTLLYMREKDSPRWRSFHTHWPDLRLDGTRMRTIPRDSPYLDLVSCNHTSTPTLRWPRGPMRIQRERRRITDMGRSVLGASPPGRRPEFR